MKLQRIIRAALCAALVAVCLAGAGWFTARSVAGQETDSVVLHGAEERTVDYGHLSENSSHEPLAPGNTTRNQQIYRPGLRNSFVENQLSPKELNLVLTQLRHKTGFVRMRFDEAGFLTIDDRSQIEDGSEAARDLLLAAIDGKKSITLQSHNRSPEVIFARVGTAADYTSWRSDARILVAPIEIDFNDFNHLRGHRKAMEAFDLGFAILHELCHAVLELHDSSAELNAEGDCESYVNRIRRELGVPERRQYAAGTYWQRTFPNGSNVRTAELVFAESKPGRGPESRAKTRKLYLRWDTQPVGNIGWPPATQTLNEKIGTGTARP